MHMNKVAKINFTGLYTHLSDEHWQKPEHVFLKHMTLNICRAGHKGNCTVQPHGQIGTYKHQFIPDPPELLKT